jgi:beta-phosphoglucomutase-like phosphatase (HAD superfamily)
MKLQGVLFDFNGVIIDDYPLQKEAWSKMSLKLRGREVTDEEMLREIRGVQSKETLRRMSENKLSEEELDKLTKEKEEIIISLYTTSSLYCLNKGLPDFFNALREHNIPRTIATSSSFDQMQYSFNKLNLAEWFDIKLMVYNDGTVKTKPAPDAYLRAAEKLNLNPEDCVVFEDAISGITAAYNAGVKNIVAIGDDIRLPELTKFPGVIKGIRNFTEITVEEIFQ